MLTIHAKTEKTGNAKPRQINSRGPIATPCTNLAHLLARTFCSLACIVTAPELERPVFSYAKTPHPAERLRHSVVIFFNIVTFLKLKYVSGKTQEE